MQLVVARANGRQQNGQTVDSLQESYKKEEVMPVLAVLRKYAQRQRPNLIRELDAVELVVPNQPDFPANAESYRWQQSDVVSVNLLLLLDYTVLSDLVAASTTGHPDTQSIVDKTVDYYQQYLNTVHPGGTSGEGYVVLHNLESNISDSLAYDSILEVGKFIRHDIVAWAVLHEISHHILGHTAANSSQLTLLQIRRRELDADLYSFGLLHDLGFSLTNLRSFFQLRSRIEPLLIERGYTPVEEESDHPSWATRLRTLDQYIAANPPVRSSWVAFGVDKFAVDDRLAATRLAGKYYRLIQEHYILPINPEAWGNVGLSGPPYLMPVAVSIENGQAHLYWRSDVFLSHLAIENPEAYSSSTAFTITTIDDGNDHTAGGTLTRDSAFRWGPDVSLEGGISLAAFQATPVAQSMLDDVRSVIRDPKTLHALDAPVANLVKSTGGAFLSYMKGSISKDQYLNAIQLSYRRFKDGLASLVSQDQATTILQLILASSYYKVIEVHQNQIVLSH